MHTSDTLKGAADYFHIPYANLKATVVRVSQMAKDSGKDLDFHNRGGLKESVYRQVLHHQSRSFYTPHDGRFEDQYQG